MLHCSQCIKLLSLLVKQLQQPVTASLFIQQPVLPTSVVQQPTVATTFVQQLVKPIPFAQQPGWTQSSSFSTPTVRTQQVLKVVVRTFIQMGLLMI